MRRNPSVWDEDETSTGSEGTRQYACGTDGLRRPPDVQRSEGSVPEAPALPGCLPSPLSLSHTGGRPRFLPRPAASCSRHPMAAASLSRSTFRSWMIRLRSTLSRLQEPGHVFVSPWRTLPGPDLQPVQLLGDLPERFAALPQPVNPLQDGLLARFRFYVALVGGLPETVGGVADELQFRLLVTHGVPGSLSNGLPLPLAD